MSVTAADVAAARERIADVLLKVRPGLLVVFG